MRKILSAAIKASGKKRDEIAAQMAAELKREVTASMLRDFTRSATRKRNVRFPAAWVPAFCNATNNDDLLRFLLSPELAAALELGEWDLKHLKREGKPPARKESGAAKPGAQRRARG